MHDSADLLEEINACCVVCLSNRFFSRGGLAGLPTKLFFRSRPAGPRQRNEEADRGPRINPAAAGEPLRRRVIGPEPVRMTISSIEVSHGLKSSYFFIECRILGSESGVPTFTRYAPMQTVFAAFVLARYNPSEISRHPCGYCAGVRAHSRSTRSNLAGVITSSRAIGQRASLSWERPKTGAVRDRRL